MNKSEIKTIVIAFIKWFNTPYCDKDTNVPSFKNLEEAFDYFMENIWLSEK